MPFAARLRNVVAEAGAEGPKVAVGITFFRPFAGAQVEFAFEIVVIQLATGQRGIGPPAILLELGEGGGQVAVELVVRIIAASFKVLPIKACRHTDSPGFIEAIATADVQVGTAAIGTGTAALTIDIQMLAAACDNRAPLADCLPALPIRLPLAAQFILVRT
ncbi:hypothetical protein D3C86_1571160 [compost metagenome]